MLKSLTRVIALSAIVLTTAANAQEATPTVTGTPTSGFIGAGPLPPYVRFTPISCQISAATGKAKLTILGRPTDTSLSLAGVWTTNLAAILLLTPICNALTGYDDDYEIDILPNGKTWNLLTSSGR